MADKRISILTATTLFPNSLQPTHGIFVETRLRLLLESSRVRSRVLAPVPWVPPGTPNPEWAKLRNIPDQERRGPICVDHPRYLVVPKIGMRLTPHTLYGTMKKRLRRLLAGGERFDVIDAHYFYPDGVAAMWLGKTFNIPVAITARGTDINLIPEYAAPRRLILQAARDAGALIAVCQALKDRLLEMGVPESKVTVLRNGVDLKTFRPLNRKLARKKWRLEGFVLASVGHLIERKGHDLVVKALATIPDATLLIVGAGPELNGLKRLAGRLGIGDRVRFLGVLNRDELCEIYNCADTLVLASSREGWANVLLEAMACGTPVVASAVWGTPEVVAAPEAGLLVQERDGAVISAAISQLRRELPERALTRCYAEKFDWQSTTDGQIKIFQKLSASR